MEHVRRNDFSGPHGTVRSRPGIYAAAFYFCSYTMTSVGYGDIGPQHRGGNELAS